MKNILRDLNSYLSNWMLYVNFIENRAYKDDFTNEFSSYLIVHIYQCVYFSIVIQMLYLSTRLIDEGRRLSRR